MLNRTRQVHKLYFCLRLIRNYTSSIHVFFCSFFYKNRQFPGQPQNDSQFIKQPEKILNFYVDVRKNRFSCTRFDYYFRLEPYDSYKENSDNKMCISRFHRTGCSQYLEIVRHLGVNWCCPIFELICKLRFCFRWHPEIERSRVKENRHVLNSQSR